MNKKKAIIKAVKKSLKHTYTTYDLIWNSLGNIMDCEFCPCNQSSCNDDCGNILRSWYKESEE